MALSKAAKLKHCSGCRDNYYNRPGNSADGVCWMLKDAKLVERVRAPSWQAPPYSMGQVEKTLNCKHEQGYAYLPVRPEIMERAK